jgi:hypothetical protein
MARKWDGAAWLASAGVGLAIPKETPGLKVRRTPGFVFDKFGRMSACNIDQAAPDFFFEFGVSA